MQHKAQVVGSDKHCIRAQHLGAIHCHHGHEHAKHAYGRQSEYIAQYPGHHGIEAEHHIAQRFAHLAHMHYCHAHKHCYHYHLHHAHGEDGLKYVFGEEIHYLIDKCHLRHLSGCAIGADGYDWKIAFQQRGYGKAQRHRHHSGAHKVEQGAKAQAAHFLHILHIHYAAYYGKHHQRNHHKFQQIQENGSKWLNVGFGKFHIALHGIPHHASKHKCYKYLRRQRQFQQSFHSFCSAFRLWLF